MGRRFLSLVLAACLLAASLPVLGISPAVAASTGWSVPASAPAAFTVGVDGTTASAGRFGNPYAVSTAQQLADLAYFVNSGYSAYSTSYFRLTADIVLNGSVLKPDGSLDAGSSPTAWTPIGVRGSQNYGYFSGYFDGNGHSVRGVYIDGGSDDQGLFGYVKDGTITNLTLEDSYIRGDENVGGIVGSTENQKYSLTTVRNCTSAATVVGARQVGGIVGSDAGNYDVVDQCTFLGLAEGVSTGENIGGIVGSASGTSVTSCAGAGLVRGNRSVGGIVGYSTRSTILHDTHTGTAVGVSGAATCPASPACRTPTRRTTVRASAGSSALTVG